MYNDACYDRGSTFRLKCFLNDGTGLLNPKSSEVVGFFLLHMILVVYLGHGIFHPVYVVVALSFSKSVLWERS